MVSTSPKSSRSGRRKQIALILPIRFAVRGILETDVYPLLRREADLLLISPFAENEAFRYRYSGEGIRHALLHDFHPSGEHLRWYNLLQKAVKKRWNLEVHKVIDELLGYHGRHKKRNESASLTWRLLRALFYSPVGGTSSLGLSYLRRRERAAFEQSFDNLYYEELFQRERPDLVVSTSPNRPQELPIARAVEKLGIPHIVYILSFDNICCYGEYTVIYDHYMVWNERNCRELLHQYPTVTQDKVTICGSLQFDFYHRREQCLTSRQEWATMVGVAADRSVILYAETGHNVAPHEPAIVGDLAERIRSANMQSRLAILVRTHPMYPPERWDEVRQKYPEVAFSCTNLPRGQGTTLSYGDHVDWDERDLALLINTLHHADVHWSVSSTMTLDAAYFDRPVVCIAYDPRPGAPFGPVCRRLYDRDHYVDITHSGGAVIATTPEEAWQATLAYLQNPALHQTERGQMLKMYDPFMDGEAAERVAETILTSLRLVVNEPELSRRKHLLRHAHLLPL